MNALLFSIGSFALVMILSSVTYAVVHVGTSTVSAADTADRRFVNVAQLCFALVLMGMLIANMISLCSKWVVKSLSNRTGLVELRLRQVALKKLEMLLRNALDVHGEVVMGGVGADETIVTMTSAELVLQASSTHSARSRFILETKAETSPTGGFLSTWHDIFTGRCLVDEGIFLFNRIVIGTVAQLIATLHLIIYLGDRTPRDDPDTLDNEASGRAAHILGLLVATVACVYATMSHIPTAVNTIRQLRTGALPSMRDPHFLRYRAAQDTPSLLLGGMFWGIWYTGFFVYFFIFLLITLLLSNEQAIVASYIAFTVTALGKFIMLRLVRQSTHKAFHRKNPKFANIWMLGLEAWNLGLGYGYMAIRALKLISVAVFSIARFDLPVLSPQINVLGPLEIDDHPTIFRRDLLAHEAHRHPYLEVLGILYVKSLQDMHFGARAHSAWRRLFVVALLPWMNQKTPLC